MAENRRTASSDIAPAIKSDIAPAIKGADADKASTKADGPVPNAKAPDGFGELEAGD